MNIKRRYEAFELTCYYSKKCSYTELCKLLSDCVIRELYIDYGLRRSQAKDLKNRKFNLRVLLNSLGLSGNKLTFINLINANRTILTIPRNLT